MVTFQESKHGPPLRRREFLRVIGGGAASMVIGGCASRAPKKDAAEFGMGMRLTVDRQMTFAKELLDKFDSKGAADLIESIKTADVSTQEGIEAQRGRVSELKAILEKLGDPLAKRLLSVADFLVPKSIWVLGGDGWGYRPKCL